MIINFEKIGKELNKQGIQNFLGSPEKELMSIESLLLNNIDPIGLLKHHNLNIELAVVLNVNNHPDSKYTKLWVLTVEKENGERIEMLCNLKTEMQVNDMLHKKIMIVTGLPEKVIGNVKSNAMFFRFVTRF